MPFAWIKSTGIKWTAREKERSGKTWKEEDNCWRKAQGMGSEKEWTGKEKKVCTHTDGSFAKPSSCYSLSLPMFSHFLLDSFFSNLIFFFFLPSGTFIKSFALCSLLLSLLPHVASTCIWLQVVMKFVSPDLTSQSLGFSSVRLVGTSGPANIKQPIFIHSPLIEPSFLLFISPYWNVSPIRAGISASCSVIQQLDQYLMLKNAPKYDFILCVLARLILPKSQVSSLSSKYISHDSPLSSE